MNLAGSDGNFPLSSFALLSPMLAPKFSLVRLLRRRRRQRDARALRLRCLRRFWQLLSPALGGRSALGGLTLDGVSAAAEAAAETETENNTRGGGTAERHFQEGGGFYRLIMGVNVIERSSGHNVTSVTILYESTRYFSVEGHGNGKF